MKVPILFIIFNRPDIALKSFQQIRQYQPENLYIAADGPRPDREDEDKLCEATRNTIINAIDWDCNVHKLFREKNIGVDFGVYSAINWMFETEKWGIIIEDDCILSVDFFHLCEAAFPKYENEEQVVHIVANNLYPSSKVSANIVFSSYPMSWGWATWRDKWNNVMDVEMQDIGRATYSILILKLGLVRGILYHNYWHGCYKFRHELKTWDTIWQYSVMSHSYLSLMPEVNLATNNGIGTSNGSHFKEGDKNFFENLQIGSLTRPYKWPIKNKVTMRIWFRDNIIFVKQRWFGFKKKLSLI